MAVRFGWLLALGSVLVGCTKSPTPFDPDAAVVSHSEAATMERLERGLRVRGFTLMGRPTGTGPIEAVSTGPLDRGWADCPTLRLTDPSRRTNRNARAEVSHVTTRVTASVQPLAAAETRVAVRTANTGNYVNIFTNGPQQGACSSTGVLERALLEAARL